MSSGVIARQGGFVDIRVPIDKYSLFLERLREADYEVGSDFFMEDKQCHYMRILLEVNKRAIFFQFIQDLANKLDCPMVDETRDIT